METLVANFSGLTRRETVNGRKFIVAPLTMIVPGVLNGSAGPLLYPEDEVAASCPYWEGVILTDNHLPPGVNGRKIKTQQDYGMGYVQNPTIKNGRLKAEGWFDVDKTRRINPNILSALERGDKIELSTGLNVSFEDTSGIHNGRQYNQIVRKYRPDHLAILIGQRGACSVYDGCGVNNMAVTNAWSDSARQKAAMSRKMHKHLQQIRRAFKNESSKEGHSMTVSTLQDMADRGHITQEEADLGMQMSKRHYKINNARLEEARKKAAEARKAKTKGKQLTSPRTDAEQYGVSIAKLTGGNHVRTSIRHSLGYGGPNTEIAHVIQHPNPQEAAIKASKHLGGPYGPQHEVDSKGNWTSHVYGIHATNNPNKPQKHKYVFKTFEGIAADETKWLKSPAGAQAVNARAKAVKEVDALIAEAKQLGNLAEAKDYQKYRSELLSRNLRSFIQNASEEEGMLNNQDIEDDYDNSFGPIINDDDSELEDDFENDDDLDDEVEDEYDEENDFDDDFDDKDDEDWDDEEEDDVNNAWSVQARQASAAKRAATKVGGTYAGSKTVTQHTRPIRGKKMTVVSHFHSINHTNPGEAIASLQEHLGADSKYSSVSQPMTHGKSGWKLTATDKSGQYHHFRINSGAEKKSGRTDNAWSVQARKAASAARWHKGGALEGHQEGDKVRINPDYGGSNKSGVVIQSVGNFHTVKHSNGSTAIYHESDLASTSRKAKVDNKSCKGKKKKKPVTNNKEPNMSLSQEQKDKLIDTIISNCDCYSEDDRKALAELDDRMLKSVANGTQVNNTKNEPIKVSDLPVEMQRVLNYGAQAIEADKAKLIDRLVANQATDEAKKARREVLSKLTLDELQDRVADLPVEKVENQFDYTFQSYTPNFSGAGAGRYTPVNNQQTGPAGGNLGIPELDFSRKN